MKTNEILYNLISEITIIKQNQKELIETIEDLNRLLISQNEFFKQKENARRKYLEKELNKKWWQI